MQWHPSLASGAEDGAECIVNAVGKAGVSGRGHGVGFTAVITVVIAVDVRQRKFEEDAA